MDVVLSSGSPVSSPSNGALKILYSRGEVFAVIILLHPRSTRPKNRRFPLAVLSLAAILEGKEQYAIVDGNADGSPGTTLDRLVESGPVELLAVSVMPGPQ